jgi:hypothetical protein
VKSAGNIDLETLQMSATELLAESAASDMLKANLRLLAIRLIAYVQTNIFPRVLGIHENDVAETCAISEQR